MSWLPLLALALLITMQRMARRRFRSHWQHLSTMASDLASGRKPRSFVFHEAPDFTRLALELERVHEEQKRLRQQVSTGEFNLQMILASMAEGVMVVGGERTIRLVNSAFIELFNLKGTPVGRTILSSLRSVEIDGLIRLTLETGRQQAREIALSVPGALSQTRFLAANAMTMVDPQTGRKDVVAVFHDISRLRRLEEIRREFVANVSHELKTPLSIFQGYLETLEDPALTSDQLPEIVGVMKKHSLRLNAILEDLLSLARLEARTEKLERSRINLISFFSQLEEEWRTRCEAGGLKLQWEVEPGLDELQADPLRLQQVLINLLQNAIKYTGSGGRIILRGARSHDHVEISVADTGIGIPPADLPHIFERFYRVEKGRSRDAGGTGLGLSIVKHIMALHGGSVSARSEPGQGTTVSVRFPLKEAGHLR